MKRKTNLFYTSGPDSKFLTFSNYTESLTGNFLSTDTKLYPSMFLCLNIPELNNEEIKETFIKDYLVGYYENKLAVLRDAIIADNKKCESIMTPLAYLFDTIEQFINNEINTVTNQVKVTLQSTISCIGDITEQDYNGTYTDTICIIDLNNIYNGILETEELSSNLQSYDVADRNLLYGWTTFNEDDENDFIRSYSAINIKYDKDTEETAGYICNSKFVDLEISKKETSELSFNVIIPLFDLTNINYHTNEYVENTISESNNIIDLTTNGDAYNKNVPLGIWFADDNVTLKKDNENGFSQSWSLLISSQFKPFPYSHKMTNQIDDTSNSNAFPTFAMILSKQNDILDQFSKMSRIIAEQQNKINYLNDQLKNTGINSNVDKIKRDFINFEYEMTEKYNKLEEQVKQFMNNLTWNAVQ